MTFLWLVCASVARSLVAKTFAAGIFVMLIALLVVLHRVTKRKLELAQADALIEADFARLELDSAASPDSDRREHLSHASTESHPSRPRSEES